jgi:hypothetical protein
MKVKRTIRKWQGDLLIDTIVEMEVADPVVETSKAAAPIPRVEAKKPVKTPEVAPATKEETHKGWFSREAKEDAKPESTLHKKI